LPLLANLLVDLDERWALSNAALAQLTASLPGVEIAQQAQADERLLAWIDDVFGGMWSSEARAGTCVIARRGDAPIGFAAYDPKGLRFPWLRGLARERGVAVFGPFGVSPAERSLGIGTLLLNLALAALRARGYARALIAAVGEERLIRYYAGAAGARVAEQFDRAALLAPPARTIVMASGNGSNFQAVLDSVQSGALPLDVIALVSNNPQAYANERARRAGLASIRILPWSKKEETRDAYDARLLETVGSEKPELVLLLGWMHVLAPPFVHAFPQTLNVHPAFLPLDPQRDDVVMPDGTRQPAFRGPHAVRDALAAGSRWTGATVHRITASTDRGPVLVRKPMRIPTGEDEAAVMDQLHGVEHALVGAGITRWLYERA
jgi:phosphoribosylglycinamide formyltransferase-1